MADELVLHRNGQRWPAPLLVGSALLSALAIFAIVAPLFGSPVHQDLARGLTQQGTPLPAFASASYPLGTDSLGRNELARLADAARISLIVALVSNVTSLTIATLVGVGAALYGKVAESVSMRITDIALAFPYTLAALVLASMLPSGPSRVIVIITALFWAYPARLVYNEAVRVRPLAFVDAATAAGASRWRVATRHVLPHVWPLLLTFSPLNAASAVLFEATLSFLGAGVNPPTPSWGNMVAEGQQSMSYAPHLLLAPSLAILMATMAFLLIGEGTKVLNPDFRRVSWLGG